MKRLVEMIGLDGLLRSVLYKTLRRKTTAQAAGVSRLFVSDTPDLARRVLALGGEKDQLEKFISLLRPGDVVWDVGAFMGMYSVFSSKAVGPTGRVIAFEPESAAFQLLQRNIALNKATNIMTQKSALSDVSTSDGRIYGAQRHNNAIHSLRRSVNHEEQGQKVQIDVADQLVEHSNVPIPNAIKMDVEGAEMQALSGMRSLLLNRECRLIFLEVHPEELKTFEASVSSIDNLLADAGFETREKTKRGTEYHYFCFKKGE